MAEETYSIFEREGQWVVKIERSYSVQSEEKMFESEKFAQAWAKELAMQEVKS